MPVRGIERRHVWKTRQIVANVVARFVVFSFILRRIWQISGKPNCFSEGDSSD